MHINQSSTDGMEGTKLMNSSDCCSAEEVEIKSAVLDGKKIAFIAKLCENTQQQSDFRYVSWGATREQIKRTEARTGPIWYEDENVISYETTFDSRSAIVAFLFANDRLTEGIYRLLGTSDDYGAYSKTMGFFSLLFGTPVETKEFWTDAPKKSPEKNTAIRLGELHLLAMWETPRSRISVLCQAKEGQGVIHSIRYESESVHAET